MMIFMMNDSIKTFHFSFFSRHVEDHNEKIEIKHWQEK